MPRSGLETSSRLIYSALIGSVEVFGFIAVVLIGVTFHKKSFSNYPDYDWDKSPFPYHPLLMTIGLLFCYGNAILFYRTFRGTKKLLVKILHGVLLLVSFVFALVGLVAIIRSKNLQKRAHFMTFHSWIGLTTIILFGLQWVAGFSCYLFPKFSLDVRRSYMPTHRFWGKMIFTSAVIAILTGLSEHGMTSSFYPPTGDTERNRRLIMNFFAVFVSLFYLVAIYLLTNPDYQRPAEESPEK